MTLGQITAREDFAKRIAAQKPVYLHECLYPLMQGWDSVEIKADVELGGTEQLFSLLVARDLQQAAGPGAAGGHDDADPGRDRRRAPDGQEPGELHRGRRAGREPVRQDHEHPRRADEAVLHAAHRTAARRGRSPAGARRQPAGRQGSAGQGDRGAVPRRGGRRAGRRRVPPPRRRRRSGR